MALTIRGVRGQVTWAYQVAAELSGYTVERHKGGGWTLRATIAQVNGFALSQRPLTFVAPHAKGEWRWPIRDCQTVNGVLTAELGTPEE